MVYQHERGSQIQALSRNIFRRDSPLVPRKTDQHPSTVDVEEAPRRLRISKPMAKTESAPSGPRTTIVIPARLKQQWRNTLSTANDILETSASRITRLHLNELEVFEKSERDGTLYVEGERAPPGSGLYCETVMGTKKVLVVKDGRRSRRWRCNADVERGMISYMGLPLFWPEGQVFGTICVLDNRVRGYTEAQEALLEQLQRSVEKDLLHLDDKHRFRSEMSRRQRNERLLREAEQTRRAASRQLQVNDEQERAVVSRQLHDEIMQGLTAVKMDLSACTAKLPADMAATLQPSLTAILDTLDSLVVRVRQLSSIMASPVLQDLGLPSAIEWELEEFGRSTGIPTSAIRLDDPAATQPFANVVMHRALQRVLSHVQGLPGIQRVELELRRTEKRLTMMISAHRLVTASEKKDAERKPGLAEIAEEIRAWGGRLRAWQTPDEITMVQIWLPHNPDI